MQAFVADQPDRGRLRQVQYEPVRASGPEVQGAPDLCCLFCVGEFGPFLPPPPLAQAVGEAREGLAEVYPCHRPSNFS